MADIFGWIDRALLRFVEYAEREAHDNWDYPTDSLW